MENAFPGMVFAFWDSQRNDFDFRFCSAIREDIFFVLFRCRDYYVRIFKRFFKEQPVDDRTFFNVKFRKKDGSEIMDRHSPFYVFR